MIESLPVKAAIAKVLNERPAATAYDIHCAYNIFPTKDIETVLEDQVSKGVIQANRLQDPTLYSLVKE